MSNERIVETERFLTDMPASRWMNSTQRIKFAAAVNLAFEECLQDFPGRKPDAELFRARVNLHLKQAQAFPAIILFAIISWLIQRLLDYLWSRHVEEQKTKMERGSCPD